MSGHDLKLANCNDRYFPYCVLVAKDATPAEHLLTRFCLSDNAIGNKQGGLINELVRFEAKRLH
jgi:hypothetical protein